MGTKPTLILVRHANRDTSDPHLDNGLNEEGKTQAKALAEQLRSVTGLESPKLISSPRARCIETLEPIKRLTRQPIQIDPRMLEERPDEGAVAFKYRIQEFLKEWYRHSEGTTIVCSHADWLSYALKLLVGARGSFKKAAWVEIGISNKKPVLKLRPNFTS